MLKNIDPLLSGELISLLDSMGHGDELLFADRNFPAQSTAFACRSHILIIERAANVTQLARAVFSIFPIDTYVDAPILRMEIDANPLLVSESHAEFLHAAEQAEGRVITMGSLERQNFYQAARRCFAVVQCGESRPYSCFIVKKGVVNATRFLHKDS